MLARLPQPLALIEVGASAGLCLLPDHYGYDYGSHRITGTPMFRCAVNDATPIPKSAPQIVWRAGLDLNPLDISNREQIAWLETLVWPEQTERLRQSLNRATGKDVEVKVVVDPSVLGGIMARVGDLVIDGSVRHRLEQLREQI